MAEIFLRSGLVDQKTVMQVLVIEERF